MRLIPLIVVLPLLLIACTNDDPFEARTVDVSIEGLPPLDGPAGQYVLWFSYPDDPTADKRGKAAHGDEAYVPVGRFLVDTNGEMMAVPGDPSGFTLPAGFNPQLVFDAIVTVESPGAIPDDPGPRLLAGPVRGTERKGNATLALSDAEAFGNTFAELSTSTAFVTLTTPSTAATDDEERGVWFVATGSRSGLDLVTLPPNRDNTDWVYRGWVISSSESLSLGSFRRSDTLDMDGKGPEAGELPVTLPAPGSDFVTGADRRFNDGSWTVVVSLDPDLANFDRSFLPIYRLAIPIGTDPGNALVLPPVLGSPIVNVEFDR